jgi:hypothetical protein
MAEDLLDVVYDRVNKRYYSDGPISTRYPHPFVLTNTASVSGAVEIRNIIALTQAQYNTIAAPDANTFYVITP